MNKDIRIKISANHRMMDTGETHEVPESVSGQYFYKNNTHYIIYDSVDEDSSARTNNTIKITDTDVIIIKKGQTKSSLHFTKGMKHKSDYITPFGTFGMETDTDRLLLEIGEDAITVDMKYNLALNGVLSSECNMKIMIENE